MSNTSPYGTHLIGECAPMRIRGKTQPVCFLCHCDQGLAIVILEDGDTARVWVTAFEQALEAARRKP